MRRAYLFLLPLLAVRAVWAEPLVVGHQANPRQALPVEHQTKPVIGVMGSAAKRQSARQSARMRRLGKAIASAGAVILTGACNGLPQDAVLGAKQAGGVAVGISPFPTLEAHRAAGSPTTGIDVLQVTRLPDAHRGQNRPNMMGREIDNIERSDALIFAGGRSGTLGEFAIAYEEGKPIGVLKGTGGVSKLIPSIVRAMTSAGKAPRAPVIYDSNPDRLVRRLLDAMKRANPTVIGDWDG